ncbi:MAG TPA: metallophosphoesterase, partial [Noviherbaspirillum sp.]|nr:metallophosphoesterase [Noviherbaspirillum sp.]
MRIGIVSDIHGNLAALEAVVADMRRRGVDQL